MPLSLCFGNGIRLIFTAPSWNKISPSLCFSPMIFLKWHTVPTCVISFYDMDSISDFLISWRRKELHLWQADVVLDQLLQKGCGFLCSAWERSKDRESSNLSSVIRHILWARAFSSLILPIAAIIGLFSATDLIIELDFEVFLTDALVHLAASINWVKRRRDSLGRPIILERSIKISLEIGSQQSSDGISSHRCPNLFLDIGASSRALPMWIWL